MSENIYALSGSFAMKPGLQKGLTIYRYDLENGGFQYIGRCLEDINMGQQCPGPFDNVHYITNECRDRDGMEGKGGEVLAVRIDPDSGMPHVISRRSTLVPQPSYLCLDRTNNYLLVVHHVSDGYATRLERSEDGNYRSEVVYDDAAVVCFHVMKDGSLGEISDVWICRGEERCGRHVNAHLHSITMDPTGELFVVCDKGLDRLYSFKLDERDGKLRLVNEVKAEEKSAPRYSCFHPTQPVLYQNSEQQVYLNLYHYDTADGKLERISRVCLLEDEEAAGHWCGEGPADLAVSPDGRYLYASVRTANLLAVLELDSKGNPCLIQNISCGGKNPRGIALSPDSRFLFVSNRDSDEITRFTIGRDGRLTDSGERTKACLPGNLLFTRR